MDIHNCWGLSTLALRTSEEIREIEYSWKNGAEGHNEEIRVSTLKSSSFYKVEPLAYIPHFFVYVIYYWTEWRFPMN